MFGRLPLNIEPHQWDNKFLFQAHQILPRRSHPLTGSCSRSHSGIQGGGGAMYTYKMITVFSDLPTSKKRGQILVICSQMPTGTTRQDPCVDSGMWNLVCLILAPHQHAKYYTTCLWSAQELERYRMTSLVESSVYCN